MEKQSFCDKGHKKLVKNPESLSTCDLESVLNQSGSNVSPNHLSNDLTLKKPAHFNLQQKISVFRSTDVDFVQSSEFSSIPSCLSPASNLISSAALEQVDQNSNNFEKKNIAECRLTEQETNINLVPHKSNHPNVFNSNITSSHVTMANSTDHHFKQSLFSSFWNFKPEDQSQSGSAPSKFFYDCTQIPLSSNNPFLNFDEIANNDKSNEENFFKIDDDYDPTLLFRSEHCDDQVLKNKREKFSTTSKICLVVSPPTNKLIKVRAFYTFFHFKILNYLFEWIKIKLQT